MDDLDLGSTIKGFSPGQKVFTRYTLARILGRGGMGVVWLAKDEELAREAALKFLPEVVAADPTSINDLKREVRRAIDLAHPHIIKTHDFVTDGRTAGVSMEYLPGGTLSSRRLEQPGQVFTPEALGAWTLQLCQALQYAHEHGEIVHRDLKPTNLMLDIKGRLKVVDFGIAASISESVSRVSKQAGSSGTPVYMSPQQMMGENPAVTDDVYAVGGTLYELLTGKPPFHAGNIVLQVQTKVAPPLNERRQALGLEPVPAVWEETIAACLAKDPKDRPQSAEEIAERLGLVAKASARRSTSNLESPAPNAGRPASATAPVPNRQSEIVNRKSRTPLYAALAAAVVLLGGLGWYFGLHAPEQKRLAEIARLEAEGRAAEAARLRNEKEQADAVARGKAEAEQQAYAIVVARVDALLDGAPVAQRDAAEKAVQDYLASAPARYRTDVEGRWAKRLGGWETHRANLARGGFRIRTNPEGAEVKVGSLALEQSPVTRNEVRLGKYPVAIRAEGYEEWRGEIEVKENDFTDPGVIALVRSTGTLDIKSDPTGAEFTLQQEGREGTRRTGTLPGAIEGLPTGAYRLSASFPGLAPVERTVEVARGSSPLELKFAYGAVRVTSEPAGAEVWRDGRVAGRTPLTLNQVAAGNVSVEVRNKGFARQKLAGRVDSGRTLELTAALKQGGLDDPEVVAQSILDELEKEPGAEARAGILASTAFTLQRLGKVEPELVRAVLDRQLAAARQIQNPKTQLTVLGNSISAAAELDLAYSRAWAEEAVAATGRITGKTDRSASTYVPGVFWMHPDQADRMATIMDDWFSGSDDEWASAAQVAGMHKRFGNERGAQLMAARAKGPYRDDSINNNLKNGIEQRATDPILLRLLHGDIDGARQMLRGVAGSLDYAGAASLAYQFLQRGDAESIRQLGSRVEANMAPYFPSLLVNYSLSVNNPAFAESVASGLSDEGDSTRRTDAYRNIAAYYAKIGLKDKARVIAAQISKFNTSDYGMDRQQAVPVLVMVGDLNRARQLAQAVPVSYAADKASLAVWNGLMFLSLGDTASFERCFQLYVQSPGASTDWLYAYQIPQMLATLGRLDEAESLLGRARDVSMRNSGRNIINLARLRAAKPEEHEALIDAAAPGSARAAMLSAVLQLRLEKQQLARNGL